MTVLKSNKSKILTLGTLAATGALANPVVASADQTDEDHTSLKAAIDQATQVKSSPAYQAATQENKQNLDDKLKAAQDAYAKADPQPGELQIATDDLLSAISGITQVFTEDLQNNINNANAYSSLPQFSKLSQSDQDALKQAVNNAQAAVNKQDLTQQEAETANNALKTALNNVKTAFKTAMQQEIDKANALKSSAKYQRADTEDQTALNNAIETATQLLNSMKSGEIDGDTSPITDGFEEIDNAIAYVDESAKEELSNAIDSGNQIQSNPKYAKASDQTKQALTSDLNTANDLMPNRDATMDQIDASTNAIKNDLKQVDKDAKKDLETSLNKANTAKSLSAFNDADESSKNALTSAIAASTAVDQNENASMNDIDTAKSNLDRAIKGVSDSLKADLQKQIANAQQAQKSTKYQQASQSAKSQLDNVITSAQQVLSKDFPSKQETSQATNSIKNAIDNLDYSMKGDLRSAIVDAQNFKNTPEYTNGLASAKSVFDSALAMANNVNANSNAPKASIDAAITSLRQATDNLKKGATDTLRSAIQKAQNLQNTPKVQSASEANKQNLAKAINDAQNLANNNSTDKSAIDNANKAINDALNAIDTAAKGSLDSDLSEAKATKSTNAYTNADPKAQVALDTAISNGENVKDNLDATLDQINQADNDLKSALSQIESSATGLLDDIIKKGNDAKSSDFYNAASQDAKTSLDNALNKVNSLKNNANASKDDISSAQNDLIQAIANLKTSAKAGLKQSLDAANKLDPQKLTDTLKNQLANAIDRGNRVMTDQNATMNDVNNAKTTLDNIVKILSNTGNKNLGVAINNAQAILDSPKGQAASQDKQKALSDAINNAKNINRNNPSDADVKSATDKINQALNAIDLEAKSDLKAQIANAADVQKNGNYNSINQDLKNNLTNALNKAQEVENNTSALKSDIDTAASGLKAAISAANEAMGKQTPIDKSSLDKAISDSAKLTADSNYDKVNSDLKTALNNALTVAKTVSGSANAKQSEIDQAAANLTKANGDVEKALSEISKPSDSVDKTQLNDLIKQAEDLAKSSDFNKVGSDLKDDFNNTLSEAKATSQNADADKDEVDVAVSNLESVIKSAQDAMNTKIDKTRLNELIKKAEDLQKSDAYTNAGDDLKTDLVNALTPAKEQAEKGTSQADIDDAADYLEQAIDEFDYVDPSSASSQSSSSSSSSSASSSASSQSSSSSSSSSSATDSSQAKQTLQNSVEMAEKFKSTNNYKNASKSYQDQLQQWIDNANRALNNSASSNDDYESENKYLIEALDQMVHTNWVDSNGNQLKDTEDGAHPDDDGHSDIAGYKLVGTTRDSEMNIVNLYEKDNSVMNYYFDSDGNQIAQPSETSGQAMKINGYTFMGSYTVTAQDVAEGGQFAGMGMSEGNVINIYEKDTNSSNSSNMSSASSSSSTSSSASSNMSSASSATSQVPVIPSSSNSSSTSSTNSNTSSTSSLSSSASSVSSLSSSESSQSSAGSTGSTGSSASSNISSTSSSDLSTNSDSSSANSSSSSASDSDSQVSSAENETDKSGDDTASIASSASPVSSVKGSNNQGVGGSDMQSYSGTGRLPQTGSDNKMLSAIGLAISDVLGLFGLSKIKKRKKD